MTVYTLMAAQRVPNNTSSGPVPTQVVVSGAPRRGTVSFFLVGPNPSLAQASLWARTGTTPYGYNEDIQLLVMNIPVGRDSQSQDLPLNLAYYESLFAELNIIDRSQSVAASMTLTV